MLNRFCIFILLVGFLAHLPLAHAENEKPFVYEENRNIFLKLNGQVTQLTKMGRDSSPILSPDGRWVAFNREIEGKVRECSKDKEMWACASNQLWILDMKTQSERLLLKPREDAPELETENVIYQFNRKKFSPDSQTIYFITPAWTTSSAIHAVGIDGINERYVMHGYSFEVIRQPLSPEIKKYLSEGLKEDDWRIFPNKTGASLIEKALKDDVIGYLLLERSGFKSISSPTPIDGGYLGSDGQYHLSIPGRRFWTELISPDGHMKIPITGEWR